MWGEITNPERLVLVHAALQTPDLGKDGKIEYPDCRAYLLRTPPLSHLFVYRPEHSRTLPGGRLNPCAE